jgi:hypothetical protein
MKSSRSLGVVACVYLALACGRAPTVQGRRIGSGTISVQPFVVDDRTRIEGYDAPTEALASRLAVAVAEALQERGKSASSGPTGSPATADVLVTGRVTEIDGGSRAKRAILGMGAGRAEFSVEGEILRLNGEHEGAAFEGQYRGIMFANTIAGVRDAPVARQQYGREACATSSQPWQFCWSSSARSGCSRRSA